MDIYCTRPNCPDPVNAIPDLDDGTFFRTVQQRYCAACTMPLVLDGRYLPLERLGGGAFGTTFLGLDLRSAKQRHCVIKQLQLRNHLAPNQVEGVKRAFRREAEILEVLGDNHHQIPTLFAYFGLTAPGFTGSRASDPHQGEPEEYIYLVQEYVQGRDLDKELRQNGRFSEADVLEIMQQVLPVLQFIHDRGAIHRDIKPSNMMRDQNGRIYLIDFGAVKQVTTGVPLKSNSLVFGTLGFAPPEQIAGKQVYPSTDLYSLAVTALCLLTGQSPEALLDANGDSWNWHPYTRVSDRLEQLLDKMLEFVPGRRFQSAKEVLAAITARSAAQGLNQPRPNADDKTLLASPYEVDFSQDGIETQFPPHRAAPAHAETLVTPPSYPPQPPQPLQNIPGHNLSSHPAPAPVPPNLHPALHPVFVKRCREELAYYIGPIAGLVVEEAIAEHTLVSLQQFVEILAQEIPDPQAGLEFRRKLLS
ncbi:protein kinase domain-containing protein [Egbenema bharatensis]|uniref:protein kinase domain-containing protein n=1 Tax=Egbenema bharatensis TaxID=3463334 RepID=UPI003A89616C